MDSVAQQGNSMTQTRRKVLPQTGEAARGIHVHVPRWCKRFSSNATRARQRRGAVSVLTCDAERAAAVSAQREIAMS